MELPLPPPEVLRDQLRLAIKLILGILVALIISMTINVIFAVRQAADRIVAMSPDGRLVRLVTLDEPFVNSRTLSKHVADMLTDCLTMQFTDYQRVIQDKCRVYFATPAFNEFRSSLERSNLMQTIVQERMALSIAPPTPVITNEKVVRGVRTWEIEAPLTVTLASGKDTRTLRWLAVAQVSRASNIDIPSGIYTTLLRLEPRSGG